MAIDKATTTKDIKSDNAALPPTRAEMVAQAEAATSPEMLADTGKQKYTKVKSPAGVVTTVPDEVLDALKDSGYSVAK